MDLSKFIENKGLTEIEIKVLNYIVDNIDEVNKLGVRGIAKNNYTSTSTIMRLSKKLGYSGFLEMQYNLASLKGNELGENLNERDFVDSLDMDSLLKENSSDAINKFVDILFNDDSKFIFIYANGFSGIVAEYINKKLLVMGKRCILSNGTDSIGVFENNLDYISSIIVISKSGETPMVLNKVKTAKEHGINVIAFTNERENSISKLADVSFKIDDANKLDDRNLMPNTFFPKVLVLVELLIYEYYKRKNSNSK
ncbi:MurR/RpiR family transcriptional regulator [Clostridium tertium]|uniref:MurR/RpiR family transcriptional regulator n=1 Tax=Clostridium tertium TaxID=1559 RepID=UPI0023304465|nr:MurR/RpiR family transcriptional regulator [Clostridium tertium]MBS6502056.1 MurR/RpiR family transcriptional regulator [Clostridium sp.]MDB1954579.1 MurR/RpiR family transcriptional regulator [Clostridium tertium]MDB1957718.1 MurR/RpiR family transcriptional regulator [Clostridium tertium]MDB1960854.1 MurR/RpiR family transcriptional regulator [Clostridium tertium]MDB1965522.1 MurR/RpiR family transcriptional regulator [Clostridium tertium]